jgi:hypothetical protein
MGRGLGRKTVKQIETCSEILEEIQPATVRAVCYRLFVAGEIASMAKSETQKVSRWLTAARENDDIPWEWIVDETREAETTPCWDDPASFAHSVMRGYRRDKWTAQPCRVEVWSEKGTVRGTLAPVLREFEVPFRVMHGFGSATAVHEAAMTIDDDPRPFVVLYVGDWDPSGLYMSQEDLPTRLDRYISIPDSEYEVRRIALIQGDLEQLPSFEAATKVRDPRHDWFVRRYGRTCSELDAMSPVHLRRRVEDVIIAMLDRRTWDRYVAAEELERKSIMDAVSGWNDLKAPTA